MNFRKKRYTNKETGIQYRVLDVSIVNLTKGVKAENSGLVVYSDVLNTMYFAMEAKEFMTSHVEGWLTKEELGIKEEVVEDIPKKEAFSIHFTIKDQDLETIKAKITESGIDFSDKELHHCFLSKEVVVGKGFDTELVDYLDSLCPTTFCHSGDGSNIKKARKYMIKELKALNAKAIFVGAIVEGVEEELELIEKAGLDIIKL